MTSEGQQFADALTRVVRLIKSGATETMRTLGIHTGQNYILDQLWREDSLTPGELARRIGVEVSTVTRATQRMEAAGLVRRVPDDSDARLVRLTLTERGNALRHDLPPRLDAFYDRALAGLTPAERATLVDLLQRVSEKMSHHSAT